MLRSACSLVLGVAAWRAWRRAVVASTGRGFQTEGRTAAATQWVVVTGGGSGIGRALVQHFSRDRHVLTCGRRLPPLEATRRGAANPSRVHIVEADIAKAGDRERLAASLPEGAELSLLIQNAAIGDPADFRHVSPEHLEYALRVNVVAPMALAQLFLPALQRAASARRRQPGAGRILHLGTSVAHRPQKGTLTYGVTKMAFHRLYRQINAEGLGGGVVCGSLSPGLVKTKGVMDHVGKARALSLPHVQYFDDAFAKGWTTPVEALMACVEHLLSLPPEEFAAREWKFSEWAKQQQQNENAEVKWTNR